MSDILTGKWLQNGILSKDKRHKSLTPDARCPVEAEANFVNHFHVKKKLMKFCIKHKTAKRSTQEKQIICSKVLQILNLAAANNLGTIDLRGLPASYCISEKTKKQQVEDLLKALKKLSQTLNSTDADILGGLVFHPCKDDIAVPFISNAYSQRKDWVTLQEYKDLTAAFIDKAHLLENDNAILFEEQRAEEKGKKRENTLYENEQIANFSDLYTLLTNEKVKRVHDTNSGEKEQSKSIRFIREGCEIIGVNLPYPVINERVRPLIKNRPLGRPKKNG